jgi:hypothetical protein
LSLNFILNNANLLLVEASGRHGGDRGRDGGNGEAEEDDGEEGIPSEAIGAGPGPGAASLFLSCGFSDELYTLRAFWSRNRLALTAHVT